VIGLSTKTIAEKLFIKEGYRILFVNFPENYLEILGVLPDNVTVFRNHVQNLDLIQIFVKNREELEEILPEVKPFLNSKGKLWVTYYKGTSQHKTDINRDTINVFGSTLGFQGVAIISIDEELSALRFKKVE